jgi:segregation and condensation protein A
MRGGGRNRLYRVGMPYAVQTPVYEGPFDLLLHLILRQQVDLYEVSLAAIVDAYLIELEQMDALDLDIATEFLLIAATLVELKARRLLPDDSELDLDDELALWEERDLLLARLLECKTYKDASLVLARLSVEAARSYPRTAGLEDRFLSLTPDLLEGVTPDQLAAALRRALAPRPVPMVEIAHIHASRASVMDAVAELVDELPRVGRISFRALTEQLVERLEVVVRFLAVLELYKQGIVDIDQATSFGEIQIRWLGAGGRDGDGPADDESDDIFSDIGRAHAGAELSGVDLAAVDSYEG